MSAHVIAFLLSLSLAFQISLPQVAVTGRVSGPADVPIPGAVVRLDPLGTAVTTDKAGLFVIEAPLAPGTALRITVSARGFVEETLPVTVVEGRATVNAVLRPNPEFREEVEVSARSASASAAAPALVLGPGEVRSVAGAADNVFRVLQTLPGVAATDDFGSRLSVRGGGPDQNLTVMDGVEIHNPYRLFGLTSAFNPETVDRFELTAGGFSARYGDRLSSILVIDNRAGTTTERLAGSAAISATDANIVFEGLMPRGSWLVTGRRTYYDVFAERVTDNDLPSFADVQAKGVWNLGAGRRLTLFALRSRERTDAEFSDAPSGDRLGLDNASSNDVASVAFLSPLGTRATTETVVSWYRYGDSLDVDGSVTTESTRSNAPEADFGRAAIVFNRTLGVRDVSLRQELNLARTAGHTLSGGLEAHALVTDWAWRISGDRNESAANGSAVIGGTGLPDLLDSSRRTTRVGGWVEDDVRVSSRWRLAGGIRVDWNSLSGESLVSPRFRATFAMSPTMRVKLATGRFTQSPGYEKLLQSDYFVDLSDGATAGLRSETARHAILGLERELGSAVTARVEAYYKSFDRLILGRLETPDETAARVAQYAFPAALASSVPSAPQITTSPVNGGRGRAYGFDVYVEKRARRSGDRVSGWASYTWGRATTDRYGATAPLDYDRRHALSLVSTLRLSSRWDLGATLRVASGFPDTWPVGVRVASTLADGASEGAPGSLVPRRDDSGLYVWTIDNGGLPNLNASRLPVFARLDLRMTYRRSPTSRWSLYFEAINALNRDNAGSLSAELSYDPASDRPAITLTPDGGLPLLPSFGFRVRF